MNTITTDGKTLLLCAALLAAAAPDGARAAAELTLRDQSRITASSATLRGGLFNVDGSTVSRDMVGEITFALNSQPKAAAAPAADPQAKALFDRARTLKTRYQDAGAILLADEGTYIYEADGTWTERARTAVLIARENKKANYSAVLAYQEPGRSRAAIISADIYFPDGRVIRMDPSRVKKTAPQGSNEFFVTTGEYISYELQGIETGCIVDYTTETRTYNPHRKDFFMPYWYFQGDVPVDHSSVSVTLPKDMPLHYAVKNYPGAGEPVISSSGAYKTYAWRLDSLPPLYAEPQMPPFADVIPSLKASLLPDWSEVYDWSFQMLHPRGKPSDELRRFTLELVKDASTQTQKAAVIYHYVQKNIRYVAVKSGIASGFGGYPADVTWKRGWGCCIDKALLLTAMLSSAGIESYPVYLNDNTSETTQTAVPNLLFDHAITLAVVDGKRLFLDSTGYDYTYPAIAAFDHGVNALVPGLKAIVPIPLPAPRDNGKFYAYKVKLAKNGDADIAGDMTYSGATEAQLRGYYRESKPQERELALRQFSKQLSPKAELKDWEILNYDWLEKPFSISIKVRAPGYAAKAGDRLLLSLPDLEMGPHDLNAVSMRDRAFPVQYESSLGIYHTYTLEPPSGLKAEGLPLKLAVDSKHYSYSLECAQEQPGAVVCRAAAERKSRLIPAEDYGEYKNAMERAAEISRTVLFFRSVK
ncbi:MAG: DUF3857 and transglutaminase domain-containing protein [Elusimicrobia bacterium]|nr:DUF3857 and transglutaminase domain-containing protein [Elusimicrobiota bacterium]